MVYQIPSAEFECEYSLKKSRFIARVVPVASREAALEAVEAARARYPDARHHCWAYLLGRPADAQSAGMNDDGEPAGTAGKPILNVLQQGDTGDALVVVSRYFGGIKLGAGGLVRAYSTAAQQAVDQVPTQQLIALCELQAKGDFSCEQSLRHWLSGVGGEVLEVTYQEGANLLLRLPQDQWTTLVDFAAANRIELGRSTTFLGGSE